MSVIVRSPVVATAPPTPSTFSDTFNRASGALGNNWMYGTFPFTPVVAPVASSTAAIGAGSDGPQACIWSNIQSGANPNTIWRAHLSPIPVYKKLYGVDQFVECQFIRNTGAGANEMQAGPAVFQSADVDTGYYFEIDTTSASFRIVRYVQSTLLAIYTYTAGVAAGDTVRVSCANTGSQINFRITKNGGNLETTSDATAQRVTFGSPGYYARGAGGAAPGDHQFRNFVCGPGQ